MPLSQGTGPYERVEQPQVANRSTASVTSFSFSDYLFWLMMLTVSVPNILEIWGIDTVFKPYRVISIALATITFPKILRETGVTRRYSVPLFTALVYVTIVTAFFGGSEMLSLVPLIVSCLSLYFSTFAVTSRRSLNIGLLASVISFFGSAAYGLFFFFDGGYRLNGLFTNPNSLGYAGCLALLAIWNRAFAIPSFVRFFGGGTTIGLIVLTGSRGAMLALFATIASQLWRQPQLFRGVAAGGILIGLASLFFAPEIESLAGRHNSMLNRYSPQMIETGGAGRLEITKAALDVSLEYGFVGVGLGQFRLQHFEKHFQIVGLDGRLQRYGTHCTFTSLLCEWGIVGFACFALIFSRLIEGSKNMFEERDWILGYVGATLLMGISTDLLGEVHFWAMLGTSVQMLRFSRRPTARMWGRPQW